MKNHKKKGPIKPKICCCVTCVNAAPKISHDSSSLSKPKGKRLLHTQNKSSVVPPPRLSLICRHRHFIWFFSSLFLSFFHCLLCFDILFHWITLCVCACVWGYSLLIFFCWVLSIWSCVCVCVCVCVFWFFVVEFLSLWVCALTVWGGGWALGCGAGVCIANL